MGKPKPLTEYVSIWSLKAKERADRAAKRDRDKAFKSPKQSPLIGIDDLPGAKINRRKRRGKRKR